MDVVRGGGLGIGSLIGVNVFSTLCVIVSVVIVVPIKVTPVL